MARVVAGQGDRSSETTGRADRALCYLRHHPLFRETKPANLETLATRCTMVRAPRKTVLFRAGDPCHGFHFVAYGRVKLYLQTPRSVEKPIQIIEPGGSVGDINMFLERPYFLSAVTLEDCLLVYIPRDAILELIEHESRVALRMLGSLSLRMRNIVDDIESFFLQPPATRLATYLSRLLPANGAAPARIELKLSKNVVAAQLNLQPETLSRHFRELVEHNIISLHNRTIIVHDIDRLANHVPTPTCAVASTCEALSDAPDAASASSLCPVPGPIDPFAPVTLATSRTRVTPKKTPRGPRPVPTLRLDGGAR